MKGALPTAYNRAYLATVLRTFAQIRQSRTSDTLRTLSAILTEVKYDRKENYKF